VVKDRHLGVVKDRHIYVVKIGIYKHDVIETIGLYDVGLYWV